MKTRAQIAQDAIDAEPPQAAPFWGATLLIASLGSWALIIGAARLVAGF